MSTDPDASALLPTLIAERTTEAVYDCLGADGRNCLSAILLPPKSHRPYRASYAWPCSLTPTHRRVAAAARKLGVAVEEPSQDFLRSGAEDMIFMQMYIHRLSMAATARLMVLMSPEERASLDTKARTLGVSAGEVVRRAVQAFELGTEEEAAELRGLIDAFNELHPETLRIADEAHRKVTETLAGPSKREPASRRRKETAAA